MSKVNLTYLKDGSVAAIAQENIEAGLVVENCPILKLSWPSNYQHDPSIRNFAFTEPCSTEDCVKHGSMMFIPLGWGMLYRQDDNPNCNIFLSDDRSTMVVQANQNIKPNSLLTINRNSITPGTNNTTEKVNGQQFVSEDLDDDEVFMAKMAKLLESQNQS